eukprot:TRINITY_DN4084_c0_g1_i1.p1 TRINITY_DN4084_c0_g1~~TRINITY_DN4084_c0_g1_i1.p1  ORF type:complete len:415 (-),score=31.51 TRINITY_DN4084_c0_g1_i1:46-1185(-)
MRETWRGEGKDVERFNILWFHLFSHQFQYNGYYLQEVDWFGKCRAHHLIRYQQSKVISFSEHQELQSPVAGALTYYHNNKFFLFGGYTTDFNGADSVFYSTLPCFKSWTCTPFMRIDVWLHNVVAYKDSIYLFNISSDHPCYLSLSPTNPTDIKLFSDFQKPYSKGQSAVIANNTIFFFGGQNMEKQLTNDLTIFNLDTSEVKTISALGDIPERRYCHSAVMHYKDPNLMILFGGWGEGEFLFFNDIHLLNLQTFQWRRIDCQGAVPKGRCQVHPFFHENFLIVVGGAYREPTKSSKYGDKVTDCQEIYALDVDLWVWSRLQKDFDHPCSVYGLTEVQKGRYWLSGGMHSLPDTERPIFHSHVTQIDLLPFPGTTTKPN